jgi:hypothetical protein
MLADGCLNKRPTAAVLNNKPAARNDHTAQPGAEPTLNRFALKPLALPAWLLDECEGCMLGDSGKPYAEKDHCS